MTLPRSAQADLSFLFCVTVDAVTMTMAKAIRPQCLLSGAQSGLASALMFSFWQNVTNKCCLKLIWHGLCLTWSFFSLVSAMGSLTSLCGFVWKIIRNSPSLFSQPSPKLRYLRSPGKEGDLGNLVIKWRDEHFRVLEVVRGASVLLALLTTWSWRLLCCQAAGQWGQQGKSGELYVKDAQNKGAT